MKKHSGTLSNHMSKSSRRQSLHTNKTQLTFGRSADQLFFFFAILQDKAEKVSSCLHSTCSYRQDELFHTFHRTRLARSLFRKHNMKH